MKKPRRIPPPKRPSKVYVSLWKVVDGAIRDAFLAHPEYLTEKGARGSACRRSIAKRVTGALTGFVEQSARGQSGGPTKPLDG